MSRSAPIAVVVTAVEHVAQDIKRFSMQRADGQSLPHFSPGSHVTVEMPVPGGHKRNPYSLMGPLDDPHTYQISVLRVLQSRGGSQFMHDAVNVGDQLQISEPFNLFQPESIARRHILIAGGIGITPFMAMTQRFAAATIRFELHYAVRSRSRAAYADVLSAQIGSHVHFYCDDEGDVLDVRKILSGQPLGTHLYVCGPEGMIDAVLNAAREEGWPEEYLHCERFTAAPSGEPFDVRLVRSNLTVHVPANQTVLEAVEQAGVDAPCLCRGGACGQCETAIISHDGALIHNDHYLSDDDKASGEKIMICVSRLAAGTLTLDL
ncbi:MAG: PDR/VanB family oxidoreductase [Hyphomicrobium sp.]|nr:oxidoreductase [Hyphomicrobium sp.]